MTEVHGEAGKASLDVAGSAEMEAKTMILNGSFEAFTKELRVGGGR